MLILLSPAKKLNMAPHPSPLKSSHIQFPNATKKLVQVLKNMPADELKSLMKVSDQLAELNHRRYQQLSGSDYEMKQAICAFQGDVYQALSCLDWQTADFEYAQTHCLMLSGLYGLLRPLDLIAAHRLEMSSPLPVGSAPNLYAFWRPKITHAINHILSEQPQQYVINLASNAYFKAVDATQLIVPYINIVFKEDKANQLKTIGLFAKQARGLMARYIICNRINSLQGIQSFNEAGYHFRSDLSDEKYLTFVRTH